MGPLGIPELIFILVIALLIFGPKRLPEFGRTIGKALGEFRRASTDLKRSLDVELAAAEEPPRAVASARAVVPAVAREDEDAGESDSEDEAEDEAEPEDASGVEVEDGSAG